MKNFIFDLQRFDLIESNGGINVSAQGFEFDPVITWSGEDLVNITTSQNEGGSVTVENDYNFSVDNREVKISNVDSGAVTATYGEKLSISLDLSNLVAESGEILYVISAADADNLIPSAETNQIKIGSKVYNYASGGASYFKLKDDAVEVDGYVLAEAGDSITVGKNQNITVCDENEVPVIAVAKGANYTVTKTKYNYTIALTESSTLTIGDTTLDFTIKSDLTSNPIVITFEDDGTIDSVDGLYNLTGGKDKLIVNGANITEEYKGLPVYDSKGTLDYISVSDGDFTLNGGTASNQKITANPNATVYKIYKDAYLSIVGTNSNDDINNINAGTTIQALGGNDTINTSADNVMVDGGKGNDYIYNSTISGGDNVTLIGGKGNDSIENEGSNVIIDGGNGNDSLRNGRYGGYEGGSNVSISGGAGNDSIFNDGSKVTIAGGKGNDYIQNVFYTEEGDIYSDGENNLFEYSEGDGNDTIVGFNVTSTLQIGGGTGSYFTQKSGSDIIVNVGDGKISLVGAANLKTVNIEGTFVNPLYIVGTKGKDKINNTLTGATIRALGGYDKITNKGSNVSIDAGTGKDTVENNADNVTINGGTGNDYITNSGNNVMLISSAGNNTINNKGGYNYKFEDDGYGSVDEGESISGSNVSINTGAGNDSIINSGNNVLLSGGKGNDTIVNSRYYYSYSYYSQIEFDEYYHSKGTAYKGKKVTINGGKGNDLISLESATNPESFENLIIYNAGDGNDTISGFNEDDTLSISGGTYSTQVSGSDVIVKVGKGTITLTDFYETTKNIHINNETIKIERNIKLTEGNDSYSNSFDNATISALGGNDSITNIGNNVTLGSSAGNNIINNEGSYSYNSWHFLFTLLPTDMGEEESSSGSNVSISTGKGNDSITNSGNNVTLNSGAGDDTIENKGNYNYLSYVGLSIPKEYTGHGPGGGMLDEADVVSESYSGRSVSINAGDGNDSITNSGSNVLINGGAGNDTIVSGVSYNCEGSGQKVFKVTIDGGTGNDLIVLKSANENQNDNVSVQNVITYNSGDGNDLVQGFKSDDTLQIGDGKGTYSSQVNGKDVIVTVGDGNITLQGAANLESLNISGKKANSWKLSGTTATYGNLITVKGVKSLDGLSLKNNVVTVSEASLNKENVTISEGYTLKLGKDVSAPTTSKAWSLKSSTATYNQTTTKPGYTLADNTITYSENSSETLATVKGAKSVKGLSVSDQKITLKNSALSKKVTIGGGYEFDFAKDYKKATISGSSSNDSITVRGTKVSINAGKGDDTIKMLGSTTTVTGGDGADTFVYGAGKNVIADYSAEDKISIGSAISKTTLSGSNVVFTIGSGTLTVKNGKGKTLTLIDSEGVETSTVIGGSTSVTLTNSSKAAVTLESAIKIANASKRTKAIKITGNGLDNTISGGSKKDTLYGGDGNDSIVGNAGNDKLYGQNGNDTLWGGKGNDTLWGGSGDDTFIYKQGEGKDVIYGFENNDLLQITGTFSGTYNSSKNEAYFKVGSTTNAITLKDFTATSFNVNGDTYKISSSKLTKQ